jgi:hypothetical protein
MKNKKLFFASFIFFLVVLAGMLWTEKQSECQKDIIIPLELASSISAFKALLVISCKLEWIEKNTQLDFVFIISYTLTFFFALRFLTQDLELAVTLRPLIWLVMLPGILDAVENTLLIKFLYADANSVSDGLYSLYYWCVHLKFAMIIIILSIILVLFGKKMFGGRVSAHGK